VNNLTNREFCVAFGSHLKRLRAERNFSLRQFALEMGIEHSQLSRIENGTINTTISTAYKIAETLQIPVKDLFDFKFSAKSKK
jgi:transcriptional regulator with XRE-family HTH domain